MADPRFEQLPAPAATQTAAVRPATIAAFTEGPAVDADGTVYFSDIWNNRILKLSPDGQQSVFRQPSGRTNGHTFDRDGRLWHCEGSELAPDGGRRITRTDLSTDTYEIVTERYEGARYNSPNDICVDGNDRVYFSDPLYTGDRSELELDVEGVYRIDTDGSVTRILGQAEVQKPNGLAATQDSKLLYVVDHSRAVGGHQRVWCFDLDDGGNPSNQRLVFDFAPGRGGDGMRLDVEGNLYVAAGISVSRGDHETEDVPAGIYIISPDGELIGRIPIYEDLVTNLAFGGADGRTLYITAGKSLFTTRVDVPGQVAYPRWES